MDRLRALPGVTTVGVVNNIPLDEGTNTLRVRTEEMSGDAQPALLDMNFTGGDYFRAMSIPMLQGRPFTQRGSGHAEHTTWSSAARRRRSSGPSQNPLGRRIRPRFGNQDTLAFTVVGVVGDVKQNDWREAGEAIVYFPLTGPTARAWGMGSPAYVVKSSRAESLKREVRALVHEVAPEAPVYREFTMEFLARRSMIQLSFTTLTLGVVSALALILGAVGLYGVLSYVVAQRTREIGVRMALGATAAVVRRQVVSQGAKVVLVGVVIGVAAAFGVNAPAWHAALRREGGGSARLRGDVGDDDRHGSAGELHAGAAREQRGSDRGVAKRLVTSELTCFRSRSTRPRTSRTLACSTGVSVVAQRVVKRSYHLTAALTSWRSS